MNLEQSEVPEKYYIEVPVHRHRDTSETVVCLRGWLVARWQRWRVARRFS